MSMMVNGNSYGNYTARNSNAGIKKKESTDNSKGVQAEKQSANQPQLSEAAQKLLEKLKKAYGNMDFMVLGKGEDAKEVLSRGTKEISVLFSSEELEKMASDEKYEKEYMDKVQGALRMSEEINKKYGYTSAFGKNNDDVQISKIAISFDDKGNATYFAELEKSSGSQKERIEQSRQKRAEEKREAEKDKKAGSRNQPIKKTIVKAGSVEELIDKIDEVDWSKIKGEWERDGGKFDFSA